MTNYKDRALELLRESLLNPYANFHEHQWESISHLVNRRGRLLVVQKTGWGKSAVYFIATKLLREEGHGPTIIISPLLALMRNQIASAASYGVILGSINSSNSVEKNEAAVDSINAGELDAIIISPEKLSNPDFNERVFYPIADRVGLFVIDEAHCISDWGYDFRPDYKRIVNILPFLPDNLPILATTATANKRVIDDVCVQLDDNLLVFRGNLTRESLYLQTITFPKRSQRLAWLAGTLLELEGTGIVYTSTMRDADQVANWLKSRGLAVEAYHSNIGKAERLRLEEKLLNNELKALTATSALGMGYDKPDLSFVIHYQSTGSVISYYQQVGRAGRGIPKAHGVLLSGGEDDDIQQYFIQNAFPKEEIVQEILDLLQKSNQPLRTSHIISAVNARPQKIEHALRFLLAESPAPIMIEDQNPIKYGRTLIDYELPHETMERLSKLRNCEWKVMQEYIEHDQCLMNFLSNKLDDPETEPCGRCSNCSPDDALPIEYSHETGIAAAEFLENVLIDISPRKKVNKSHFPKYQLPSRLESEGLQHESGRALCRWGEAGWGEIAMLSKKNSKFDSRLVDVSAKLILERWKPDPFPSWVTYVPSHSHPELVPVFAQVLANQLGLPCLDVVKKLIENQPQKFMENSTFRCRNLDGVFQIDSDISGGPVLLVDDAVDSQWTFTVIAALLLRAGSGSVFPFAIMSTKASS